jgi:CBS domain-containing protein
MCTAVLATHKWGYETDGASEKRKGVVRMPRVRDKMVSSVVSIEPGTGVVDAAKRMIQEEKGPLPIVEGERPVAIVTDRDIIAHVVAEGRDPKSMTVDNIASHDLTTIGPEQDTSEARRLMDEHELDRILVVEDDKLVGLGRRRRREAALGKGGHTPRSTAARRRGEGRD